MRIATVLRLVLRNAGKKRTNAVKKLLRNKLLLEGSLTKRINEAFQPDHNTVTK